MKAGKVSLAAVAVLAATNLAILLTGTRVLVWQEYVPATVDEEGNYIDAYFECTYFTGRSRQKQQFHASDNSMFGVQECPFTVSR